MKRYSQNKLKKEPPMKKIILALTVAAFAIGVQAGEGCADKDKAACGDKDKAAAACPASKDKSPAGETAKKDGASKPTDAPKGDQKKS